MSKSKATVVVNLDPEAQAQWRAALEERDKAAARIAELEAELAPWREMARQLDELRGEGWQLEIVSLREAWGAAFFKRSSKQRVISDNLPAAVAAAYRKVKGVGDE